MNKDKPYVPRYLLSDITKTRYYGVVHMFDTHITIITREKSSAIVYLDSDLGRAKEALKKDKIPFIEIPLKEGQLITLLDWQSTP